ncbi:MAG: glycosyltransferase family 2 protein [Rhizobiaceae bacterium]
MTAGVGNVTVVTISYNSGAVLRALLGSVPAGAPTIVVDNASTDDTPAVARTAGAELVAMPSNQGFGRACNAGAKRAKTPFLFFVNPDALLEPGCIEALLDAAERWPKAAAFNPRIENPSGRVEFKWRSVLLPRSAWIERGAPDAETEVPALVGGAFFCRREAFEQVGGFDPAIFLYHEDDDLSIRMRQKYGPLVFVPAARARHEAGHSSGRSPDVARFKGFHMVRSRVYALAKHRRPLPWLRTFAAALGGLVAPHNLFSARRRAKYLGQVTGAWSALRDGGVFS